VRTANPSERLTCPSRPAERLGASIVAKKQRTTSSGEGLRLANSGNAPECRFLAGSVGFERGWRNRSFRECDHVALLENPRQACSRVFRDSVESPKARAARLFAESEVTRRKQNFAESMGFGGRSAESGSTRGRASKAPAAGNESAPLLERARFFPWHAASSQTSVTYVIGPF
jgi:hypothetical protein